MTTWYPTLQKPWFNPPPYVFGPLWTVLYLSMGVAAWRVWRSASWAAAEPALFLWCVQLLLNLAWSVLFFGLRATAPALIEIVALFACVCATAVLFCRRDRLAGLLMAPYAAWVAFAGLLTFSIWRLN